MRPSFFALFKRGKYYHAAPLPSTKEKGGRNRGDTRETERFAAAAIAFAWEHEPAVREHFWKTVCHVAGDPNLARDAEIFVEAERWADLLIINPAGDERFIYAVEFKIGASLAKHQNPTRHAFGQKGGYGRLLVESDPRPGAKFRYIVFGFPDELNLATRPWRLPILPGQRSWEEFASGFPQSPFGRDLALSLGRLGVDAFPASETKSMKVDTKHSDLGNAVRTMAEVQRRLGWPSGRGCTPEFHQEPPPWGFGLDLKNTPKVPNAALLAKIVNPPKGWIAWIGYEGGEDQQAQLCLYLYCGDAATQKKIAALLSRKLTGFDIESAPPEGRYFNIIVNGRTNHLPSDVEWFCSIFRALAIPLKK